MITNIATATHPQYAEEVVTDFQVGVGLVLLTNACLYLLDLSIVEVIELVLDSLLRERGREKGLI